MQLAHRAADNVMPFPASQRAPLPPLPVATEPTWSLPAIARLLGVNARSPKWQARYVEQLIANAHFPRPLPTMKSGELVRTVQPRQSRWLPAAVSAWIGSQLPDAAIDADAAQTAAQAAARLDAAADTLFGGERA